MPRGGARPGAGRKPKVLTEAKQAVRKQPDGEKSYVDADGVRTEHAPENWPFGRLPAAEPPPKPDLSELMPLDYLLSVMRDEGEDKGRRMQAATLAAPYCHPKKGEASKKEEAEAKAKAAAAGRFGRREPPRLVAAGGKKI